jgi:hypothetical protein
MHTLVQFIHLTVQNGIRMVVNKKLVSSDGTIYSMRVLDQSVDKEKVKEIENPLFFIYKNTMTNFATGKIEDGYKCIGSMLFFTHGHNTAYYGFKPQVNK